MQNTQSQQSIVRTDFTLKYYQIDELLAAHRKLKIRGANSSVFLRSWSEFSCAREDIIVPWVAGDIEAFLKVFSKIVKNSVADVEAFTQCLAQLQKDKPIVIVVNINEIAAAEFTKLLDALKNADSTETKTPAIDSDEQSVDTDKLELSGSNNALASIVVWAPKGEQLLSGYQSVLAQFAVALDVGGTEVAAHQSSKKGLYAAIGALVIVGCAGFYWKSTIIAVEPVELLSDTAASSVQPTMSEDSDKSIEQPEVSEKVAALPESPKTIQVESELVAVEELLPLAVETELATTEDSESTNQQSEIVDKKVLSDEISDPSAGLSPSEILVPIKQPAVVDLPVETVVSTSNIEIVKIVATNSAPVINIGSSIKTMSTNELESTIELASANQEKSVDQQVDAMVDHWIAAWQQQEFDSYSQHYVATFSAKKKMSHKQWLDWRRKRIERPEWIKLSRSNIKHLGALDNGQLSITFTLSYASPSYKDKTFKKLTLKLVDDEFKIISEENLKVTRI